MDNQNKVKQTIEDLDLDTVIKRKLFRFVYYVKEENPIFSRNLLIAGCSEELFIKIAYAISCELKIAHGHVFVAEKLKKASASEFLDTLKTVGENNSVIIPSIECLSCERDDTGWSPMSLLTDALLNTSYLSSKENLGNKAEGCVTLSRVKLSPTPVFIASTNSIESLPERILDRFEYIVDFDQIGRDKKARERYLQTSEESNGKTSTEKQELIRNKLDIQAKLLSEHFDLFVSFMNTVIEGIKTGNETLQYYYGDTGIWGPQTDSVNLLRRLFARLGFAEKKVSDEEVAFYNIVLNDINSNRDIATISLYKELSDTTSDDDLFDLVHIVVSFDNFMYEQGESCFSAYKIYLSFFDYLGKTYFYYFGTPKRAAFYNGFMEKQCQYIEKNDKLVDSNVAYNRICVSQYGHLCAKTISAPKCETNDSVRRINAIFEYFQNIGGRVVNYEYAKELESSFQGNDLFEELKRLGLLVLKQNIVFVNKKTIETAENKGTVAQGKDSAQGPLPVSLDQIDSMSGRDFELFTEQLFKKLGFTDIVITPCSGDFGADVIATKDYVKYAIQCKRYSNSVGVSAVQEVIASKSLHDCHVACVLTNNYFTPAAIELAKKNFVILWDRNELKKFINQA